MTKKDLKVSLIQANIQQENIEVNLAHFNRIARQVPDDTKLVVLPEMFSTGFSMNTSYAESTDGKTVSWLQNTAAKHGFAILAGVMIKESDSYYNRALFVYPNGTYKYYDKRHLFSISKENEHYKAGAKRTVVEYLGWRICLQICYDLRFPVWSRNLNDYDVLAYLASWPDTRQLVWSILPVARAIENQCYVLAVNRTGNGCTESYAGESRIINPKGAIEASIEPYKEGVISGTLSLSELQRFKEKFNATADADNFSIL